MVGMTLRTEAPENVVTFGWKIDGSVTLGAMTETTCANVLAAAIIIRDQVILVVNGVAAGPYPRDWRRFGAGWACRGTTAATRTQGATQGAVSPIITALRITYLLQSLTAERSGNG
jgi:hypothetical protein